MNKKLTLANIDPSMVIALQPAVYSKAKTVKDIAYHIRVYPTQMPLNEKAVSIAAKQCGNTEQKFNAAKYVMDHVLEFQLLGDTRVGTLHEIKSVNSNIDTFFIYPLQGDGLLLVRCINGVFSIEDGFGEGWDIL